LPAARTWRSRSSAGTSRKPHFPTGRWSFVRPDPKGATADLTETTELLDALAKLEVGKFVDEQPTDAS